jgi:hypothetical protein
MAHDVMISYAKVDKPTADAICSRLENIGIRCWIAPRDILPGKEWGEAIIDAIEGCAIMVLVFSSSSNNSMQVLRELERAAHGNKVIIPFRIEGIEPAKSMQFFLSVPHWLDAFTPPLEEHIEKLGQTVRIFISDKKRDEGIGQSEDDHVVIAPEIEKKGDYLSEPRLMVSIQEEGKPIRTKVLDTSKERTFLIGRSKDCHLRLKDKTSSMTHAALVFEKEGYWTINDLGSTNGTYLNEKMVKRSGFKLRSGDVIAIGFQNVIVHRCISKR